MIPTPGLDDWLEPRLAGAPPELADAIRGLVSGAGDDDDEDGAEGGPGLIPRRLADAALRGFDDVVHEMAADLRSRRAALRLLAADASLTYAFEAAADLGLDPIGLSESIGPRGALGARLASTTREIEGGTS